MPIKLVCRCGRNLLVPEDRAGRILACPKCGHKMMVPGERKKVEEATPEPVSRVSDQEKREKQPAATVELEPNSSPLPQGEGVAAQKPSPSPSKPPPLKKSPPPEVAAHAGSAKPPPLKKEPAPEFVFTSDVVAHTVPSEAPGAAVAASIAVAPALPKASTSASSPASTSSTTASSVSHEPERSFGYLHDADKLAAAYLLATLLAVLAVVSMVPSGIEIARYVMNPDGDPIGRYAYLLIFGGLLQLAYALYLGQMPDWSSAWVLTAVALVQAAMYAAALSSLHLSQGQSPLVPWFDLGPHVDNGHARAWCFIMLLLASATAYFCGRVSMRWRRAFQLVRHAYGR